MSGADESRALRAEIEALRHELAEMRSDQRELTKAVGEMRDTFRSLAIHLGIAAEPYQKKASSSTSARDLPGFA